MAAPSSSSSSSSLSVLLVILSVVAVETRPSSLRRHDVKVMDSLFGSHLAALIQAPPPASFDDITEEGSAQMLLPAAPAPLTRGLVEKKQEVATAGRKQEAMGPFFRDLLLRTRRRSSYTRGRGRKSLGFGLGGGGRGCFGMKMDRIGSMSGLGC